MLLLFAHTADHVVQQAVGGFEPRTAGARLHFGDDRYKRLRFRGAIFRVRAAGVDLYRESSLSSPHHLVHSSPVGRVEGEHAEGFRSARAMRSGHCVAHGSRALDGRDLTCGAGTAGFLLRMNFTDCEERGGRRRALRFGFSCVQSPDGKRRVQNDRRRCVARAVESQHVCALFPGRSPAFVVLALRADK
jgi:hypothetical protein